MIVYYNDPRRETIDGVVFVLVLHINVLNVCL